MLELENVFKLIMYRQTVKITPRKREQTLFINSAATVFLLLAWTLVKCQILEEIDQEIPDINQIFVSYTKSVDNNIAMPPNVVVRNISMDLEKIDINKFMRKLDKYKKKFSRNGTITGPGIMPQYGNNSNGFDPNSGTLPSGYISGNMTDGVYNFPVDNYTDISKMHGKFASEWQRAWTHLVKTKSLDMALQVIYMARHKIKQLESMRYFNRHDTSYRIAFLYRRIRKIWKKLMDIMTTMMKKRLDEHGPYSKVGTYLIMHHRAARYHVDFLYMWWVLVNLHDKFKQAHNIPNTTPTPVTRITTKTPKTKKPS